MIKSTTAIWIGVGIGIVVGGIFAGCYYYSKYKKKLKEKEIEIKNKTDELLNSKEYIAELTASKVVDWFKENKNSESETDCVILKPTEKTMGGLGYQKDSDIYGDKSLVQMIYDSNNKSPEKIRLIVYDNIDTNLETQIDENNGFMVVTL